MRVLVLGTTGTRKRAYIEAVRNLYLRERHGLEHTNQHAREHVNLSCVEDEIRRLHDDHGTLASKPHLITPFLDLPRRKSQLVRWATATDRLLARLNDFGKAGSQQVAFLLMHGEYYRHRQLFSCFSWDQLLRFAPDVIVTLIDDAYDVRTRIHEAERDLPTRSKVTLDEVLLWRSAEINLGDELSHNLYLNAANLGIRRYPKPLAHLFRTQPIRHYVLAIKHPPETLYRLLFELGRLTVYASFPITSTRHHPERIADINRAKAELAIKFTVLDPVTIDELRLSRQPQHLSPRWPLDGPHPIPWERDSLEAEELERCKNVIASQIEERDYRLVDTCDCVAAYRPFYGGREEPAHGVEAEISRAFSGGQEKVMFHHPDDGSLDDLYSRIGVLDVMPKVQAYDQFDAFLRHLERLQAHSAKEDHV